jgi:hypothetical protein
LLHEYLDEEMKIKVNRTQNIKKLEKDIKTESKKKRTFRHKDKYGTVDQNVKKKDEKNKKRNN